MSSASDTWIINALRRYEKLYYRPIKLKELNDINFLLSVRNIGVKIANKIINDENKERFLANYTGEEKMDKKCKECENENLLKVADLQIIIDKDKKYIRLLENCLDSKEELNKTLREDNEILRNKLRLFKGEEWL